MSADQDVEEHELFPYMMGASVADNCVTEAMAHGGSVREAEQSLETFLPGVPKAGLDDPFYRGFIARKKAILDRFARLEPVRKFRQVPPEGSA